MTAVVASAPGKLVVLGEYAVLHGAPALVFAVNRRAQAEIGSTPMSATPSATPGARCRVEVCTDRVEVREAAPDAPTGFPLIDAVLAASAERPTYAARLDTRAFFAGPAKLGLGSSAAALCAWAGAWYRYTQPAASALPSLDDLIRLHRRFQQGQGSGVDVAASYRGGAVRYEIGASGQAHASTVQLPHGVRFAGVFTGRSAATPGLLAAFARWRAAEPQEAEQLLAQLGALAIAGHDALAGGDEIRFLSCVAAYGEGLVELGTAMNRELVTREHRQIAAAASSLGVCYKISGAGGGDLGIALSTDPAALAAFAARVEALGFRYLELELDHEGLCVEVARERG